MMTTPPSYLLAKLSLHTLVLALVSLALTTRAMTAERDLGNEQNRAKLGRQQQADLIRDSVRAQYQQLWDGMSDDAKQGYRNLVNNVYLPNDFDEEVLKQLDTMEHAWGLRDVLRQPGTRNDTWTAYGLAPRPDDPSLPLQYVVKQDNPSNPQYVMNCFACHGGNLYGATYPGSPNTTYALESLTEQVRKAKLMLNKPLAHMDIGSVFMPLGKTVGSSNAVMFGVALMNYRDAELNVYPNRAPAPMTHHDMDAPPWWHFHRKHHIYIDGFAQKGHRGLMQFMLVRQNGPEQFKQWEHDFEQVYAYLSELRPPKYPLPIDEPKALRGKQVFTDNCASCHGSYRGFKDTDASESESVYPELRIPIEDIGTDRVRLDALSVTHRHGYGQSWFADMGQQTTFSEVDGYVAPPLDGLWASAPYLHNGSVPTLWHLLHPDQRPIVWRRTELSMDNEHMGLQVEQLDDVPRRLKSGEKRWYFDTKQFGKSAKGHTYPDALTEQAKVDLLEYLKTL
jgi:mono/diheme cytochrome c family protein/cytochrome c553